MSIASDLTAVATNLNSALDEINDKIEAKGGTASETVYGVASAVENLPSGESAQKLSYGTGSQNSSILLSNGSYVSPNTASNAQGKFMSSESSNFIFNPASAESSWRIISRFKKTQNTRFPTIWADSYSYDGPYGTDFVASQNTLYANFRANRSGKQVTVACPTELNTWYYAVLYGDVENKAICISLYDDSGTLIKANCAFNYLLDANPSYYSKYGGGYSSNDWVVGYIDLFETCYEIDGIPVWGKTNSKTQNMGIFDFTDFSEFTEVEYIQTSGSQYIDTDFIFNERTKVEIDAQYINGVGWSGNFESKGYNFLFGVNGLNKWNGYFSGSDITGETADTNRHIFKLNDDGNWYVDDALIGVIPQSFSAVNPTTYKLFATYRSSSSITDGVNWKIYSVKIWNDGTLVRFLKPCYHTETGIIGMFDTVNDRFYINNGSGTFLKGADVNA